MKNIKYAFLLCIFTTVGISTHSNAAKLTNADFLCTIYPPGCPKIKQSLSLEAVKLTLSTDLGSPSKNIIDRQIQLEFPRSYVTWGPFIKSEPQKRIGIEAALPELAPHTLWKLQSIQKLNKKNLSEKDFNKEKFELHKNWLPIYLTGISQKYNNCHKGNCFNNSAEYGLFIKLRRKKLLKEDEYFKYYTYSYITENSKSYEAVLVPKNTKLDLHIYMNCDINKSTTYNWCHVESMFDTNISLSYSFETSHLGSFHEIDKKVRHFIKKSIKSDNYIEQ